MGAHVCVHAQVCMCVSLSVYMLVCTNVCACFQCVHVCMHACVCTLMYVLCACACVYMYVYCACARVCPFGHCVCMHVCVHRVCAVVCMATVLGTERQLGAVSSRFFHHDEGSQVHLPPCAASAVTSRATKWCVWMDGTDLSQLCPHRTPGCREETQGHLWEGRDGLPEHWEQLVRTGRRQSAGSRESKRPLNEEAEGP